MGVTYARGMEPAQQPRPSDLLIRDEMRLTLLESPDGGTEGAFNADGSVNVVVIRPCDGRGPGRHIYPPSTLREAAPSFSGLPSYLNHEDVKARRAAQKIRRGPDELAGELRETVWDPDFATPKDQELGFEQGAVLGKYMPATDLVEQLIRRIPGQMKLSINSAAARVSRARRSDGSAGWLVESIVNDPEHHSVDLVTAAGAGGGVLSLVESLYDRSDETESLATATTAMSDDQLVEWLSEHRPTVLTIKGGADNMNLQEALQSDEVRAHFEEQIDARVTAALTEALPTALAAREEELRESIRDELGQTTRLRGLHAEALRLIESAPLTTAAKAKLRDDYSLEDNDDDTVTAGRALALVEAVVDDAGTVTKTAKAVLKDQIDGDVKGLRNILRESAPTVPFAPGGGGEGGTSTASFGGETSDWAARLKSKGLNPADYGATPTPAT